MIKAFLNPDDPLVNDIRQALKLCGEEYIATSAYSGITTVEFDYLVVTGSEGILEEFRKFNWVLE